MKFKFSEIVLLAVLMLAAFIHGYSEEVASESFDDARRTLLYNVAEDTLITSTSTDTVYFTIGSFYGPKTYDLQVNSDQLSGTTNGTCYLQLSMDGGTDWTDLETTNLSTTTRALETGTIRRGTARVMCVAPSSTQNTAIRVDLVAHTPF